ncbi:MAG: 23S rRNA (guanosine(2251)-2'-O)-methyltransferase RlmB [Azospirillaceae bacterium]
MPARKSRPPPPRGRAPRPDRPDRQAGDPALLFGTHAVAAAWANPRRTCRRLWATRQAWETLSAVPLPADLARPRPLIGDRQALDALVGPGAVHQGLVLDAAPLPEPDLDTLLDGLGGEAVLVVLDQVTDPHNVGAILRSMAAFGAAGLIVQDRHAPPVTGTLAKTASGAVEHVPIIRVVNIARALDDLAEAGFHTVGLAEEAEVALGDAAASPRVAFVLGAEGPGLRRLVRERCHRLVALPTQPPIASLNVSNAAAIVLYAAAIARP